MRDFFELSLTYNNLIIQIILGALVYFMLYISKSPNKKKNIPRDRIRYIVLAYIAVIVILLIIKIILGFI